MTSCHVHCSRRSKLQLPEDGQNVWPKHVGILYNKYKHCAIVFILFFIYFVLRPKNFNDCSMKTPIKLMCKILIVNGVTNSYTWNLARYWLQAPWGWHDSVETCRRSVIICEIIVHLLVVVQNNKRWQVHVLKQLCIWLVVKSVCTGLLYGRCVYWTVVWKMCVLDCCMEDVCTGLVYGRCVYWTVVWKMCVLDCCMEDVYTGLVYGRCVYWTGVWKMCVLDCCMQDVQHQI